MHFGLVFCPVIDWKRSKQDVKEGSSTQYDQTKEAKRSINVIDERLKGIYKLKNSNQDLSDLRPLPVERQVDEMIADATNVQNLVQLYEGWMPWI
jgi:phosphatidylinositol kinase/protein kinase (PI-3  family)